MKNLLITIVFLLILPVLALSQATVELSADRLDIARDGAVAISGNQFVNLTDYFKSDFFKNSGKRCGLKIRDMKKTMDEIANTSDCSLRKTVIKDEYWPTVTLVIPVVFHVISHTNGNGNISDQRIIDQINVLNEDYGALEGSFGEDGFNTRVQFELVEITRSVNNKWFADENEYEYKTQLGWDQKKYLNIYSNTAQGYLGYAYMPQESAGDIWDGIVLLHEIVGGRNMGFYPYDQGRTLVHEMGHYLGLLHTFEGYKCLEGYIAGDLLVDTFSEKEEHYGCSETFTCGTPDNIHNYMNYTDDLCMNEFTPEQANRIVCSLINYRPQLYTMGNNDPAFISEPVLDAVVDEIYNYQAEAEDLDGDTLTFRLFLAPDSMKIDSLSGLITWTPRDADMGDQRVIVQVDDGHNGIAAQDFNIHVIKIFKPPVALFGADTTFGYVPLTVQFSDSSKGDIASWQWDFGDSSESVEQHPLHVFAKPGDYSVKLKVSGPAGEDSVIVENMIHTEFEPVIAGFSASPLSGAIPLFVQFQDTSKGPVISWQWDFGDTTTSGEQNPSHTYTNLGNFTVSLIVNSAFESDTLTIADYINVVNIPPTAAFTADTTLGIAPFTVQFVDSSRGDILSWHWDFGDSSGSDEPKPSHIYTKPGLYSVGLKVSGPAGMDSLVIPDYIHVMHPAPVSGFSAAPDSGLIPLTVQFSDSSQGVITSWEWDFGDSTSSTDKSPVHVYNKEGDFDVSLIVTGPGGFHSVIKSRFIIARWPLGIATNKMPQDYCLYQNYPNPFNPVTTITFDVPVKNDVWLGIYDMNGKLVKLLANKSCNPGQHQIIWNAQDNFGRNVASGVYMARIKAGDYTSHIKVILVK